MRSEKFRLNIPAFNEFVYSLLYNASIEAKRIIPPRFLRFIKKERDAKKFVRTANLDEALTLLSYLGVEHFLVVVAKDNANFKDFKQILDQYKDKKRVAALKDIIDLKLFVTGDKQFISVLGLIAQTIHHKAYTMNLELTRSGYHVHHWGKHLEDQPALEIQENSNALTKILLTSSLTLERSDFLFRLRPLDIQILLYLYPLKHTHVPFGPIARHFDGYVHKMKISSALKTLVLSQHIQKSAIAIDNEYTITALGIRIIDEYMAAVLHANNFG